MQEIAPFIVFFKLYRTSLLAIVSIGLSSCNDPTAGHSFSWAVQVGSLGQCRAWAETTYRLMGNGKGILYRYKDASSIKAYLSDSDNSAVKEEELAPLRPYQVDWKQTSFVAQDNPDLCWAASVSMAFRHFGVEYDQRNFSRVHQDMCSRDNFAQASLNQIIFALTKVHVGEGKWITQPNREWSFTNQPLQAPNPFMGSSITWSSKVNNGKSRSGGIFSILSPLELTERLRANQPIVLGYGTHVVLVIGAHARLGGLESPAQSGEVIMVKDAKLESLVVVDPLDGGATKVMSAEYLLRATKFAFAVIP